MKFLRESFHVLFVSTLVVFSFSPCANITDDTATTATTTESPPRHQLLRLVARPQALADLEKGQNEAAVQKPALKILFPANGATIRGDLIPVRIALNNNTKDPPQGNELVALTLDNEAYITGSPHSLNPQAGSELGPIELRSVVAGSHLLRALVLKPSFETYRNSESFQMATFTVQGSDGTMSPVSAVDPTKPLLTSALPKGLKVRTDAAVVIDFYLANAKLKGDGGEYRVRYIIDDDDPQWIDKAEPVWLLGWIEGKHTVRLELIGPDGWPYTNGGYNIITREIIVTNDSANGKP